jgi:hypothetical protein
LGAGPVRGVYDEAKGVYEGKKRRREIRSGTIRIRIWRCKC